MSTLKTPKHKASVTVEDQLDEIFYDAEQSLEAGNQHELVDMPRSIFDDIEDLLDEENKVEVAKKIANHFESL